jgi:hypothetical protein
VPGENVEGRIEKFSRVDLCPVDRDDFIEPQKRRPMGMHARFRHGSNQFAPRCRSMITSSAAPARSDDVFHGIRSCTSVSRSRMVTQPSLAVCRRWWTVRRANFILAAMAAADGSLLVVIGGDACFLEVAEDPIRHALFLMSGSPP